MRASLIGILSFCAITLSGCAAGRWSPPIYQSDKFECDQKCGVYDPRQSIVFAAECVNACFRSRGYSFVVDR